MRGWSLLFFLFPVMLCASGEPSSTTTSATSGPELLARIDANLYTASMRLRSRMVVVDRRGRSRSLSSVSWVQGTERAFSEYLSPPRERGTKMLKIGRDLWTYSPRSDRVLRIAGHLLRQSVMGSDLSYEDSMEKSELSGNYDPVSLEEAEYEGRPVWILDLRARGEDLAYPGKKLWVDRERFLPLRQEWSGRSGRLLKTVTVRRVEFLEGRWYPMAVLFKDELGDGQGTEFVTEEIDFSPEIPPLLFSRQSLRR